MLVRATRQDGEFRDLPIQDGEDVWRRVTSLFRNQLGDLSAFQSHYPYLTVSIDVCVQGEFRRELEHVARAFAIPVERLYEANRLRDSMWSWNHYSKQILRTNPKGAR